MRTERVFVMLFIIALGMRFFHISGADAIMICTLGGLTIMYGLFGFYFFSTDGINSQNIIASILGGILLATAPAGILFRLQYWSASKWQVMFGAMFSLITLIVVTILGLTTIYDNMKVYYRNMIARSLILFLITTALFFTPRSTLLKWEYWDDPQMATLKSRYLRNPTDQKIKKEYVDYLKLRKRTN